MIYRETLSHAQKMNCSEETMKKNLLFDIKRYAINDGPGIRITLFLKGCPLSCIWCHNPEGISMFPQKMYTKKKCMGCGSCVEACPEQALMLTPEGIVSDDSRCVCCGKCADACPSLALEMSGVQYEADRLMAEIEKEREVMDQSGGGVTFSGGEPLMQSGFLLEMLRRCGEAGIHRTVDTSLFARPEIVREVATRCELFLVDLKMMDAARHQEFCGVSNELILSNIRMIAEMGCRFWIRIPLIPGVNTDVENLFRTANYLISLPGEEKKISLLPYHEVAVSKHDKLGTRYNPDAREMGVPTEEEIERAVKIFEDYEFTVSLGG